MKILTVIGARPQFVKTAAVSNLLRKEHNEILIHTGQHYDENMSKIFFDELKIPKPDYNLGVGSGNHGKQTGEMLIELEKIFLKEKPDLVMVYGDTNSTLAGALCASKLLIPVAHVEAGLRSFNMNMPEEQNRILTDHISKYLFTPTNTAVVNLKREGLNDKIYNVGDVMFDAILHFTNIAKERSTIIQDFDIKSEKYILATIHRAENTDNINRLKNIVEALCNSKTKVVLPLHPRTKKCIQDYGIKLSDNVKVLNPIGFLDMINLEKNALKIVTDSGGVQKEAFFMKKPCITMRDETEWVETVQTGWNIIVGSDKNKIENAVNSFEIKGSQKNIFGDGNAAEKIIKVLSNKR